MSNEKQLEIQELEIHLEELKKTKKEQLKQVNELLEEEKEIAEEFKNNKGNEEKKQRYILISKQATQMEKELFELVNSIDLLKKRLTSLYQNK